MVQTVISPAHILIFNTEVADLRLVNGNFPSEGRVEVFYNGMWGTVCHDGWDNNDATVVCRQMGFNPSGAIAKDNAFFGQGIDPTWLDDVGCTGSELSLDACVHNGWGNENCTHVDDAGVVCARDCK